jgi:hypothetical protein
MCGIECANGREGEEMTEMEAALHRIRMEIADAVVAERESSTVAARDLKILLALAEMAAEEGMIDTPVGAGRGDVGG